MITIEKSKEILQEVCKNHFSDKTFQDYIENHLAGDFAVEIATYITQLKQPGYLIPAICVQSLIKEAEEFKQELVTFGVMVPDIGIMGLPEYRGVICEDISVLKQTIK